MHALTLHPTLSDKTSTAHGFTIVELILVIVVIGILTSISVVAYGGVKTKTQATAIISDLKATEDALKTYRIKTGNETWWRDNDPALTGLDNPYITEIIAAQPVFEELLPEAPTKVGFTTPNKWFYDNDGGVYNGCSTSAAGANIIIFNPGNTALMQAIDDGADDGNLSCGKIRTSGGNFVYGLD